MDHELLLAIDAGAYALEREAERLAANGLLMASLEMSHAASVLRDRRRTALGGITDVEST